MSDFTSIETGRTVATEVAAVLRACNVSMAFVVCGNQVNPLVFALEAAGVRIVTCRHEAGAAAMAEAHARLTNSIGVVVTIPGAGMANAITGLVEAVTSCSPVLLLTVRQWAPEGMRSHDRLFHGMDHVAVAAACDCHHESIRSSDELHDSLQRAVDVLHRERPQPVVVEFGEDVLRAACNTRRPVAPTPVVNVPAAQSLNDAVQLIEQAGGDIVIIAGRAVASAGATRELAVLASNLKASVVATTMGKGVFDEADPAYLGVLYEPCCKAAIESARLAIVVGSRLAQVDTDDWKLKLPQAVLRIDPDEKELSYWVQPTVALHGSLKGTLGALNEMLPARPLQATDAHERRKEAVCALRPPRTRLARALNAAIPKNSVLAVDIHEQGYPLVEYYEVNAADRFHFSGISLSLGMSLAVATGAKLGRPDACVVAVCGDGGFVLGSSELATIAMYALDLKIIVVTDDAYGTIKSRQLKDYGRALAVDLLTPKLELLAAAHGFSYRRVDADHALEETFGMACASTGTFIIEVPKQLLLQATN